MSNKKWIFENIEYDGEFNKDYEGFVYIITNKINGRKYIGRKYLHSIRKVKGKSKRQRNESNWRDYWSSSDELKEDVKKYGEENFERRIIVFCKTRGDVNRIETYYLWKYNVLENDDFYNESIGNMRSAPKHIVESRKYGDV